MREHLAGCSVKGGDSPWQHWCGNLTKGDRGNGRVALCDDNVTQSETALTNQLIAVVDSVGNEAFVDEPKKKDCSQTDNDRLRKKGRLEIVQLKPQFTLSCIQGPNSSQSYFGSRRGLPIFVCLTCALM